MRALYEDFIGSLDPPGPYYLYPPDSDYTFEESQSFVSDNDARDLGDSVEDAYNNVVAADPIRDAPVPSTANSGLSASQQPSEALPGGTINVTASPLNNEEQQPTDQTLHGQYRLAGNKLPSLQDVFAYRMTEQTEAIQNFVMQQVEGSERRMGQQFALQTAQSELRYQRRETEAQSMKQGLEKKMGDLQTELAKMKHEYDNLRIDRDQWIKRYEDLERKYQDLEAQLGWTQEQNGMVTGMHQPVESAIIDAGTSRAGTLATPRRDTAAIPVGGSAATLKSLEPTFRVHVYIFVTKDKQWKPYVSHGTTSVVKHKSAAELRDYEMLVDAVRRGNKAIGLKIEKAQPAIKVQNLNDNFGTAYHEADAEEVNLWLDEVRELALAGKISGPIMKLGWYSGKDGDEARRAWSNADC